MRLELLLRSGKTAPEVLEAAGGMDADDNLTAAVWSCEPVTAEHAVAG